MSIAALFSFSFFLGLTGAMSPGPFLTASIALASRRGPLAGPLLVVGHAALELALVLLIVLGLGTLLDNRLFYAIISFVGGPVLIYMGIAGIRGLKDYRIEGNGSRKVRELHPVFTGVFLSLSTPYWFIWWVSVALGYVMFARSLGFGGLIAFYTGHITADFVWFGFVSFSVHFGGRYLKAKAIKIVLFACNLFLCVFGLFFIIKGFQFI